MNCLLSFLLFANCPAVTNCDSVYLKKVLESQNYSHYFILVPATIDGKKVEILALNLNIYRRLSRNPKLKSITNYRAFMEQRIKYSQPLKLSKKDISKMEAVIIDEDTSVLNVAAKGKTAFFNKYFYVSKQNSYAILNHDVSEKEIGSILKILIKWNYLISMIEGNFTIEDLSFCEKNLIN